MEEKKTVTSIEGKPIVKMGLFIVPFWFGRAKFDLESDRVRQTVHRPLSSQETNMPLHKIDSLSIEHGRNPLWLLLSFVMLFFVIPRVLVILFDIRWWHKTLFEVLTNSDLLVGGLFLAGIVLYFVLKDRYLLISSHNKVTGITYNDSVESSVDVFIDTVIQQQKK